MDNEIKKIKKQHETSYKQAIKETIINNTNALVYEDIKSLLKTPPLDSMDVIRCKFLDLAKKNKIVLNTEELSSMIADYRNYLLKCCDDIKKMREKELIKKIDSFSSEKSNDVIKINKKDFVGINKKIKSCVKEQLTKGYDLFILNKKYRVFSNDVSDEIKSKISEDISKYINKNYQKQLLENVDIKILVKDTTLINSSKEQADRYLFTLQNSRLLNDL